MARRARAPRPFLTAVYSPMAQVMLRRTAAVFAVSVVLVLTGCDGLPLVGSDPTPRLEWVGTRSPERSLEAFVADDGDIVVRGPGRAPVAAGITGGLEHSGQDLILSIHHEVDGYFVESWWYSYTARIKGLSRPRYRLTVLRGGQGPDAVLGEFDLVRR